MSQLDLAVMSERFRAAAENTQVGTFVSQDNLRSGVTVIKLANDSLIIMDQNFWVGIVPLMPTIPEYVASDFFYMVRKYLREL